MRPNWFVGLPIAAHGWLSPLLHTAPPDLRTIHPDDLHITVAFLGAVDAARAERAWAVAHTLEAPEISVRLSGLAPMGNPRRPTALSVLLADGHDEVVALITSVKAPMLAAAGVAPDRYGVKPHITVARPPRKATPADRERAVAWARGVPAIGAEVPLRRIALYTWSTSRGSEERRERKFRVVVDRTWVRR